MQLKIAILVAAILHAASVFPAPVASDANALAFNSPGYYKSYRVAADAGLVEKGKRSPSDKRGGGAPVEFQAPTYRPIYREAADAWLVEKEKREPSPLVFKTAFHIRSYSEAGSGELAAERPKEKRTGWTLDPNVDDEDKA